MSNETEIESEEYNSFGDFQLKTLFNQNNESEDSQLINSFNQMNEINPNFNLFGQLNEDVNEIEIPIPENKDIFFISNKKGRKRKRDIKEYNNEYSDNKIHGKSSPDNVLRKIQTHYISFIIEFVNCILQYLGYDYKFINIDYNIKKKVNKKFISFLKTKNIREILSNDISSKFRKQKKDKNKIILNKVINNDIINKILSENYLNLFKEVYYKDKRIINLKDYGSSIDIDVPLNDKVKTFGNLLNKEKVKFKKDENISKIIKSANKNFLNNNFN